MHRAFKAFLAASTFAAFAMGSRASPAQESAAGSAQVSADGSPTDGALDAFTGRATYSVPISVPNFHKIEPQLALSYSSNGQSGPFGVGWSLSGTSTIERVSPGEGMATLTSTDTYLLDGMPLVPCPAGTVSPGCGAGGNYASQIENYERIVANGTQWVITRHDGTTLTYAQTWSTGGVGVRWDLSRVTDTLGNTVFYNWTCLAGAPTCYPSSISYTNVTISFVLATRSDATDVAANGFQAVRNQLVAVIDILADNQRVRAYELGYALSAPSGRALLTSVQEFGRDAQYSAGSGFPSDLPFAPYTFSGTSLPPWQFSYSRPSTSSVVPSVWDAGYSLTYQNLIPGDFNGDGKSDMLDTGGGHSPVMWTSNGDGTFTKASVDPGTTFTDVRLGDFNGNGSTDVLARNSAGQQILWSNGAWAPTFVAEVGGGVVPPGSPLNTDTLIGDFNGDGRADLAGQVVCPYGMGIVTWLATSSGTFPEATFTCLPYATSFSYSRAKAADVNGDGRIDLVDVVDNTTTVDVWLANTDGTFTLHVWSPPFSWPALSSGRMKVGDFNGDGMADLADPIDGSPYLDVWMSNGDSSFTVFTYAAASALSSQNVLVVDFNGDGRSDLAAPASTAGVMDVWLSLGNGQFAAQSFSPWSGYQIVPARLRTGDFDGNGKTDFIDPVGGTTSANLWLAPSLPSDLLASATNTQGGTTSYAYRPSTAYTNTSNPPIVQTVTALSLDDGRGNTATTTYQYQGGLFDAVNRRFLGFHYSAAQRPCTKDSASSQKCPFEETWYLQDYGAVSKPQTKHLSAGGVLLSATQYEYQDNSSTVPYTSLQTGVWQYVYDGTGGTACPGVNCKRTYIQRYFDSNDVVMVETDYGDYDTTGDERVLYYNYAPNRSAFIMALPLEVWTYAGVDSTGQLLENVEFAYDGNPWPSAPTHGLLTTSYKWLSTDQSWVTVSAQYDAYGNQTSTTDEDGHTTSTTYDPTWRLYPVQVTNALQQKTYASYDIVCGVPISTTDLNGNQSTVTYDNLCRPTRESGPLGQFVTFSYVALGNPATQYVHTETNGANASGNYWSNTFFDGRGRAYETLSRGPASSTIEVDTTYTPSGAVFAKSAPYYVGSGQAERKTFYYDALGRPSATAWADGATTTSSYGLWSRQTIDAAGRTKTEAFDAYGHLVKHTEGTGANAPTSQYRYDVRGNMVGFVDPAGNTTTYAYDSLGRKAQMTDPDMGRWTYAYSAAGRLLSQVDAKANTTQMTYDDLGRMTAKSVYAPGNVLTASYTWTFDGAVAHYANIGRLTATSDPAGTATMNYDALGRVLFASRVIAGITYVGQAGYDAGGRLLWQYYADLDTLGSQTNPIEYDNAGNVASIPGIVTGASYDASGRLIVLQNANGTLSNWTYSTLRGLLTGISTSIGGTTIQSTTYARQGDGTISGTGSPFANQSWSYAYDGQLRLMSATNATTNTGNTYSYDVTGNLTSSPLGEYSYPAPGLPRPHAVLAAGVNTYSYDADGNMATGAGRQFTFDGENHLRALTYPGGTAAFTYDANGSRLTKTVNGVTTIYLGDDYEETAGVVTKYVSVGGVLVAQRTGFGPSSITQWIHCDRQGSVEAITDASGNVLQHFAYDPYGNRLASTGSSGYAESRGYASERLDETGLLYLHARYYDPVLGRFISPDPTVPGTDHVELNRYAYGNDNPIMFIDPTGYDGEGGFDAEGDDYAMPSESQSPLNDLLGGGLLEGVLNAFTSYGFGVMLDSMDYALNPSDENLGSLAESTFAGDMALAGAGAGLGLEGAVADAFLNGGATLAGELTSAADSVFVPPVADVGASSVGEEGVALLGWGEETTTAAVDQALGQSGESLAAETVGEASSFAEQSPAASSAGDVDVASLGNQEAPAALLEGIEPVWSEGDLFRGDSRPSSQIYAEGFQTWGTNMDLDAHIQGRSGYWGDQTSGYIATADNVDGAGGFGGGNVYVIRGVQGLDINQMSIRGFAADTEVSVPGSIPPANIIGRMSVEVVGNQFQWVFHPKP